MFVKHLKILLLCSSPKLVLGNYILKIQFKYKSKILSFWNCIIKPGTVSSKENIRNRNREERLNLAEMESMKRSPDLRVLVGGFDSMNPSLKKIVSSLILQGYSISIIISFPFFIFLRTSSAQYFLSPPLLHLLIPHLIFSLFIITFPAYPHLQSK